MTLRPVEQQRIGQGKNGPRIVIPTAQGCQNPECGYLATDRHHCIAGGMGGPRWDWIEIDGVTRQNIVFLCVLCHREITENKARIVWDDGEWCWGSPGVSLSPPLGRAAEAIRRPSGRTSEQEHAHESPGPDSMLAEVEPSAGSPGPGPGETCPTCQRRVNHPPKADSPKSKTVSFRVPEDERESFDVLFADAAEHLGIAGHKYQKKTAIEYGLVLILQGPKGELEP